MRKNSRLKYFFAAIFIAGFALGMAYFLIYPGSTQEEKSIEVEKEIGYEDCYVLLGSFSNYKSDYSSGDVDMGLLLSPEKTPYEIIEEEGNELVVVPPKDSDPRLKNMKVDGMSFWDFEKIDDYPLCFEKTENYLTQEEYDEIVHDLYLYNEKYYTFDLNSVNSIYSAGETIPVRGVDRTWLDQTDNYALLYDRYEDVIKNSTLSFIMLENPLSGDPTPCKGCMQFIGDEKNASTLKELGFDAVGIGNHFGDGGRSALEDTINVFSENNLALVGASLNGSEDASKPAYLDMKGQKVAFFSADDVAAYYWSDQTWGANRYSIKSSSGGIGAVDHAKIKKDIGAAKENADLVVVMVSWGVEYTNKASSHQVEMAHSLIDAGADIIIGSHPHWVQQIEFYEGKPIFYSLGNYIFDQTNDGADAGWSRSKGETRQGMSLQMHLVGKELKAINIIPHKMCGYDQAPGGESANKTHNLAWKIQSGEMTYEQADQMTETQGCVWYQPTPLEEGQPFYKEIWDRVMEYSVI